MRLETAVFRPKYTSPVPADCSCAMPSYGSIQPPSTSPDFSALTRALASFMKTNFTSPDWARSESSQYPSYRSSVRVSPDFHSPKLNGPVQFTPPVELP